MAKLARLLIYPVKSLDAQEVTEAKLLASGAIAHDRAYAIVDAEGDYVNAKRYPSIHRLRSHVDIESQRIDLRDESERGLDSATFDLRCEATPLCDWLSDFFGFRVSIKEDRETGFPDDPESPGPTIISTATLAEVAAWFGLGLEEVRARFRSNIEIDDVPPFWEDRLFGPSGSTVAFSIGAQHFLGINPCQRCVVPTRHPWTGHLDPGFSRQFMERRRATLPVWSSRERFGRFYRVAINTRLDRRTEPWTIQVGDPVDVCAPPVLAEVAADDVVT